MRLKLGSTLGLFNPIDGEFLGKIIDIRKDQLELELIKFISPPSIDRELTLYFAPIKNPNIGFIVQKATELGATKIQPIITQRTIVNKANNEKLELVAIEAAEQCERFSIPKILPITSLENALKNPLHSGSLFFCNERKSDKAFGEYLSENIEKDIGILIGPEGGFTQEEATMIINDYNGVSVHLGTRILRAETAVIAALSVYQALAGDWGAKL
jgi:16S rRNA (uracil1498-N3)-methyltransferase